MEAQASPIDAIPVLSELAPAVGTGGVGTGVVGIVTGAVGVATGGAVGTYTCQLLHQIFSIYVNLRQEGREQQVQQMMIQDTEPGQRRREEQG
jgi:hypothetical protein